MRAGEAGLDIPDNERPPDIPSGGRRPGPHAPSRRVEEWPGGYSSAVQENRIQLDRSDGGVAVVVVEGEHDVYTAPSLSEELDSLLEERVPFVIDLTSATFVDSSVLRVLLEAKRRADEGDLGFAVALGQSDAGPVRRVLDITGLVPVLPVYSGREEAIEAARSGPGDS